MSDQPSKRPNADRITMAYAGREHDVAETVDVLMVNSRGSGNPWFAAAVASVKAQHYPETMLLTFDNNDHARTIGQAFNALVKESSAEFVLMMGDDDLLNVDAVSSLVACMLAARKQSTAVVHVTSTCQVLMEQYNTLVMSPLFHTGLFHREFLLNNPFNESITKGIDLEMNSRLERLGRFRGAPISLPFRHYSGYIFRQHIGCVGGMRAQAQVKSRLDIN